VLAELRNLQRYREREVGAAAQILALGLSSRKNMCIHLQVAEEGSRESVDAKCRKLTASWVRGWSCWCVGGFSGLGFCP
jgi:DNA excision repair protein ERCC-2